MTEPWQSRAKCGGLSAAEAEALFFVKKGASVQLAREFCAPCPVRDQCLEFILRWEGMEGVYAGLTRRERQVIRRERGMGNQTNRGRKGQAA